jgi:hypothetical protein
VKISLKDIAVFRSDLTTVIPSFVAVNKPKGLSGAENSLHQYEVHQIWSGQGIWKP